LAQLPEPRAGSRRTPSSSDHGPKMPPFSANGRPDARSGRLAQ
jgi:hypothetical protein